MCVCVGGGGGRIAVLAVSPPPDNHIRHGYTRHMMDSPRVEKGLGQCSSSSSSSTSPSLPRICHLTAPPLAWGACIPTLDTPFRISATRSWCGSGKRAPRSPPPRARPPRSPQPGSTRTSRIPEHRLGLFPPFFQKLSFGFDSGVVLLVAAPPPLGILLRCTHPTRNVRSRRPCLSHAS